MLNRRAGRRHFWIGTGVTLAVLVIAFTGLFFWIQGRGALPVERAASYPGDELVPHPDLLWMHGITIQAPPDQVWPWLIQIGDTRGGFYSYTFIENLFPGDQPYRNANLINPAWQSPLPGQGIIADFMQIREYEGNTYILAKDSNFWEGFAWTWLWWIYPIHDGQATRLVVRHRIDAPGGAALVSAINLTGFVMEWRMLLGIRARAEGRPEPPYVTVIEVAAWLMALVQGAAAALLLITHTSWRAPLAVGIAAVLLLLIFTYIQPPLWTRLLLDLALLAGLRLAYQPLRKAGN